MFVEYLLGQDASCKFFFTANFLVNIWRTFCGAALRTATRSCALQTMTAELIVRWSAGLGCAGHHRCSRAPLAQGG